MNTATVDTVIVTFRVGALGTTKTGIRAMWRRLVGSDLAAFPDEPLPAPGLAEQVKPDAAPAIRRALMSMTPRARRAALESVTGIGPATAGKMESILACVAQEVVAGWTGIADVVTHLKSDPGLASVPQKVVEGLRWWLRHGAGGDDLARAADHRPPPGRALMFNLRPCRDPPKSR